jgi:hypothetical protein
VLPAERGDVKLDVERVDFDLVDCGYDSRLGVEQFLQLQNVCQFLFVLT